MRLLQRFTYGTWEFALYRQGDEYHNYIRKQGGQESHTIISELDKDETLRWHQQLVEDCIEQIDAGVM